ncbi:MAG: hypothetical protein D6775_06465 [Caldilineae bacterium]|nr:MAG: hypothetical protein D6775_06465 [Caldilineae bacterium]
MNDHPDALLCAYFDGELQGSERQAVSEHLHRCATCRRQMARWREMRRLLRSPLPLAQDSAAFWQELAPRLGRQQPVIGLTWVWGLLMALGSALFQTIMIGVLLVGLANLFGLVPASWITRLSDDLRLLLPSFLGTQPAGAATQSILLTGLTWLLALLPVLLVLMLSLGMALSFLGWMLATGQSRRPSHLPSLANSNTAKA